MSPTYHMREVARTGHTGGVVAAFSPEWAAEWMGAVTGHKARFARRTVNTLGPTNPTATLGAAVGGYCPVVVTLVSL